MEKRVIKSLIIEKQNEIPKMEVMPRELVLEETCNYVFVGLRWAGKSYLMFQHIQELLSKGDTQIGDILYINFEDERIADIKAEELGLIIEAYHELYSGRPRIYLDEIQNISGWEKFARRLADSKFHVFITGSNAQMLSREIYTTLGGRFIAKEVYPFSFPEYLKYHHLELPRNWEYNLQVKSEVIKMFETYFYYGGFVETFPLKDKRSWLNSLFQKILLGDVIARNDIRNENAVRMVVRKLAESVMQPLALARILGVVKSAGCSLSHNTLVDYLQYINDAYLLFGISNYTDKLSEKESLKKRYFFDNGLLNTFIIEPESKLLENMVAIELKKKYGEEVFYYKRNVEVDFYIPTVNMAVQVSLSLSQSDIREREVRALVKMGQAYKLERLQIVTWEEDSIIEENGLTVEILPLWKWILLNE